MKYNPQKHHRHSIRLKEYDYSQAGAYFVTLVAQDRACLFGEIVNEEMVLNAAGKMVKTVWESMSTRFPNIELGTYIIMPNHFHGIVVIHEDVGATLVVALDDPPANRAGMNPAPTGMARPTLGNIIGAFKSITTHEYIKGVETLGWPPFNKRVWQRNYYEHIIRDDGEWNRIHLYIESNPVRWANDDEYPLRESR